MNTLEIPTGRLLRWLVAGMIGQALLPWALARAAKYAEQQDLVDCERLASH